MTRLSDTSSCGSTANRTERSRDRKALSTDGQDCHKNPLALTVVGRRGRTRVRTQRLGPGRILSAEIR